MFKGINVKKNMSLGSIMSAIFYSLIVAIFFYERKSSFLLNHFDRRIISEATISGIDIGLRTSFYYQVTAIAIVAFLCFSVFFLILKNILQNASSEDDFTFEFDFFHILSLFGVVTFAFDLIGAEKRIGIWFILLFQVLIVILIVLKAFAKKFTWKKIYLFQSNKGFVIWMFVQSFVAMFYSAYIGKVIFSYQSPSLAANYLIGFIVYYLLAFAVFSFLTRNNNQYPNRTFELIAISSMPIFISPIFLPMANELYLVLNQNEVFLMSPRRILAILLVLSIIVSIFLYYRYKKKTNLFTVQSLLGRFYYPMLLIMLVAILFQPPETIGPPLELFESGNPGIAVDQFFRYGKIPILETFNAHALSELYAPFLYSFINGYPENWSSFIYNTVFDKMIYFLIVYFFLRKLISDELALLTLLFFPMIFLSSYILPEYYIMGIIAVFVLHKVMAKPSFKNYWLFCFILFFTFLWRFDIGASAIPAAGITLILYFILYKKKWHLSRLILAGICTGALWFLAFIILAFIKDVPVVFRLKELLSVVSSNQVWGFSTLGDNSKLSFSLFYILVPAISVLMMGWLVIKVKYDKEMKPIIFTSISFLLCFTLFNFPRGLVRHSLVENTPIFLLGFLAIPILYLPYLKKGSGPSLKKYAGFSIMGVAYTIIVVGTMYGTKILDQSLLGKATEKFTGFHEYIPVDTKINRYAEPEEYKNRTYGALKDLFEATMDPEDTFIDFSNAPFLYIFTNRETPMYINQTPAFLSDEISQKSFLEEIQHHSIPYVVFADELGFRGVDGVPNHIRSYRISEYIYQHYEPFVELNGFDVWVSIDEKAEIDSKLKGLSKTVKDFWLYNPNGENTLEIQTFDIESMKDSDNRLLLETGTQDPQINGMFRNSGLDLLSFVDNSKYELEMEYSTKKGGDIQFYFLLSGNYRDEDSLKINVNGPMSHEHIKMTIPYTGVLKDLRIDPPTDDNFMIHSLKITEVTNSYKKLVKSYNENADLGWVPYLWGEGDTLNAKDSTPVQLKIANNENLLPRSKKDFPINDSIDKTTGNYIHLRVKSTQTGDDFKATIEYGEDKIAAGSYSFNIKSDGEFHDYLIRISSQYNWYLKENDNVSIISDQPIQLEEMSIQKGD